MVGSAFCPYFLSSILPSFLPWPASQPVPVGVVLERAAPLCVVCACLLALSPARQQNRPAPKDGARRSEINMSLESLLFMSRVQSNNFYSTCNTPANLSATPDQINRANATANTHPHTRLMLPLHISCL